MVERGLFIAFEGGEASGKSTQARLLAHELDAVLTREPGGTKLGESIRELLLASSHAVSERAELLLMVAARAEHVNEVIEPALSSGRHVVCDRFSGSTKAYQAFGRGLDPREVDCACAIGSSGVEPDLVIFLDVTDGISRTRSTGVPDRIEAAGASFHARVIEGFRALARANAATWATVDGSGSIERVAAQVREVVTARLGIAMTDARPKDPV